MHLRNISAQLDKFEVAGCQVIVVARGARPSALLWLERTGFTFPLLLDAELVLYRQLGLRRDAAKVWICKNMIHYAQEKVAGRPVLPGYAGDDLQVFGGDFIFRSDGGLSYSYPSKYHNDRPEIESLLDALR